MNKQPVFIGELIEAEYDKPIEVIKKPACPDSFEWKNQKFIIENLLSEWKDFTRKGRFKRNMSSEHKKRTMTSGSWGVGRFYFRVETDSRRIFDIYYDREPRDGLDRRGRWVLFREWIE